MDQGPWLWGSGLRV